LLYSDAVRSVRLHLGRPLLYPWAGYLVVSEDIAVPMDLVNFRWRQKLEEEKNGSEVIPFPMPFVDHGTYSKLLVFFLCFLKKNVLSARAAHPTRRTDHTLPDKHRIPRPPTLAPNSPSTYTETQRPPSSGPPQLLPITHHHVTTGAFPSRPTDRLRRPCSPELQLRDSPPHLSSQSHPRALPP
jgi:hypothetical protein